MNEIVIPLMMGIVMSISDYLFVFFGVMRELSGTWRYRIASFGAGASVAYLFMVMLPTILEGAMVLGKDMFIYPLVGFSMIHIIEKYIYKHERGSVMHHHLKNVHIGAMFLYHLAAGIVLYDVARTDPVKGLVLLFILVMFSLILSISKHSIHEHKHLKKLPGPGIAMSLGGLIGVLMGLVIGVHLATFIPLYGLVAGFMFFIVIRESIPTGRLEDMNFFVLGIIVLVVVEAFL
jgi:hypothetical protein